MRKVITVPSSLNVLISKPKQVCGFQGDGTSPFISMGKKMSETLNPLKSIRVRMKKKCIHTSPGNGKMFKIYSLLIGQNLKAVKSAQKNMGKNLKKRLK